MENDMKTFAILVATATLSASIGAFKADASPLGDCYNDAIEACGFLWPGQDSGDKEYANCVDSGLDLCDDAHKNTGGGKVKGFKAATPKATLKFRKN
jgi:hypothetical protein